LNKTIGLPRFGVKEDISTHTPHGAGWVSMRIAMSLLAGPLNAARRSCNADAAEGDSSMLRDWNSLWIGTGLLRDQKIGQISLHLHIAIFWRRGTRSILSVV
jgi:hypothetical protein